MECIDFIDLFDVMNYRLKNTDEIISIIDKKLDYIRHENERTRKEDEAHGELLAKAEEEAKKRQNMISSEHHDGMPNHFLDSFDGRRLGAGKRYVYTFSLCCNF
jgi:hypothetical protein